jgi:hypothetical protein
MLQGNRKLIALLVMLSAPILFALFGKLDAKSALDYLNIIFATYVVGNVGEHGVNAYRERKKP